MPATTKDTNNTASALAKTPSKLPSLGFIKSFSRSISNVKNASNYTHKPAAIWLATIPPGLKGLNPSTPHERATGSTWPDKP